MKPQDKKVLQFLFGEIRIPSKKAESSYYTLEVQNISEDEIGVTVDVHDESALAGLQHNCIFNETYSVEEGGEYPPFSIEQLSTDLHEQHIYEVDEWVVNFAQSKGWE